MSLCRYAGMFGTPGTGAHAYRIANLAVVDVLGTFGLAWILSRMTGWSFATACLVAFATGILAHRLFCVRTTLDALLF